jgi:tetratricopeptide (TPR) repeat protein
MTRVALMTAVLAAFPVLSAGQVSAPVPSDVIAAPAQAPGPVPIAPMAPVAPVPQPAPVVEPAPPVPPLPPLPPQPTAPAFAMDWNVMPFEYHFSQDQLDQIENQVRQELAQIDMAIEQALVPAPRLAAEARASAQASAQASADADAQAAIAATRGDIVRVQAFESQLRSGDAYNAGLGALQQRQYDRAIQAFDRVIEAKGPRADAALYWKSFGEFKLARTDAALRTVGQLQKDHPQSRYISDAKVLEAEARKQSGQTIDPARLDDDEIKLLAIQGLQRTEQAVPLLEGVLNGANSLNVKKRALYVLALSSDPRARQILLDYAKGTGMPDLQIEAIRHLASRRDLSATSPVLREVYAATTDASLKREVINAYVSLARDRARPMAFTSAPGSRPVPVMAPSPSASSQAVATELLAIYRQESDTAMKRHLISALRSIGANDQIMPLIRGEKNAAVQASAITAMGGRRTAETTQALVGLYGELTDVEAREAVISVLADQRDAETLIALARKETNARLKTALVRRISAMADQSEAAAAYLAEVLR